MARPPFLDRINIASLPEQSVQGRRQTPWVQLPSVVESKLEIAVAIDANDRPLPAKELEARVQFSTDGENLDRPQYRWRWRGNSKSGRGDNGTTCCIDHLMSGAPWMNGLFVRVILDTPAAALRYSVSVDLM